MHRWRLCSAVTLLPGWCEARRSAVAATGLLRSQRSVHTNAFPASAAPQLSTTPVAAPPATRVLVYGGGSLGLLHATLLQAKIQAARRQHVSSPQSGDSDPDLDGPSASSVHVITSQQDLADELSQHGCRVSFLQTFAGGEASSWLPPLAPNTASIDSHIDLLEPIRIPSLTSAIDLSQNIPPTHILITVKGRRALDRAAEEIYAIGKAQMVRQWNHSHVPRVESAS